MRKDIEKTEGIENGFHALALDEKRWAFQPTLWKESRYHKQYWFRGYHDDIGGRGRSPLDTCVSLAWMMSQLHDFVGFDILAISRLDIVCQSEEGWGDKLTSLLWRVMGTRSRQQSDIKRHATACVDPTYEISGNNFEKARLEQWLPNLALEYKEQSPSTKAECLELKIVETFKIMLGDEHPSTLASMRNLASTYRKKGWREEAQKLEVQVMETRRRILGNYHPTG